MQWFIRAVSLLALTVLAACGGTSDEDQIRSLIATAEAATEARDTSDAMELVADDYRDDRGNDKQQLMQFLRGYLLMHPKIELLVNIGEIDFETATRARVRVEVAMIGTQGSGGAGSITGDYDALHVELRKRDDQWRVVRVQKAK